LPRYFKNLKLYQNVDFLEVCMKDSRDITPIELKSILHAIEKSECKKIIITHGTYTMPDTARYIEANLKNNNKTIILTGSMIPLDGFTLSDGGFNLGYAMSQLEILEPGVYLAMNGKVFTPGETMKITKEGRFSSIFNTV